jgi:serine/threonine-protein kinase
MYYFLERWPEARAMFERSYALRPSYRAASNLGTLFYIEGKFDEAARWYEKALSYNANDHVVTGNLATAYFWSSTGRDKALNLFRRSIELATKQLQVNPRDAEVLAMLGGYYAMAGDTATAKLFAERSLKLGSKDASILFRAGTTYEQVGDRDRAIQWISRSLAAGYSQSEIRHQPELRALYTDPRFQALVGQR